MCIRDRTHTERFSIKDNNDEFNEKALNAFSYFAKTAMNDYELEDIDPEELIDHYIWAEVVHTKVPSNKDPVSYTHLDVYKRQPLHSPV